jgi:hypothetical protein
MTRRPLPSILAVISLLGACGGERDGGSQGSALDLIDGTGPAGWQTIEPEAPDELEVQGDLFVSEVLDWNGQILVLARLQADDGQGTHVAWTSTDGTEWDRRDLALPERDDDGSLLACDLYGGVATHGAELVVPCKRHDGPASHGVVVASSFDLQDWALHDVSDTGPLFGVAAAGGLGGSLVVHTLEAVDPNTTAGSTMRVWSSDDLERWSEIPGATADTMVNGQATRARTFGETTVLAGGDATYEGPDAATIVPAIWVSLQGAPFDRVLLPTATAEPADAYRGNASDVIIDGTDIVVVGNASTEGGTQPAAWLGAITGRLLQATVLARPGWGSANGMWNLVGAADGALLAVGGGEQGSAGEAWVSNDDGATWQPSDPGPSHAGTWDGHAVGASQLHQLRFWIHAASSGE